MNRLWTLLGASILVLAWPGGWLRARSHEVATVEAATEVLQSLAALPLRGIPPALLQDAQGVAIIPNVLKAGFVFGGRFGRGVILTREPDGSWSCPVFITLAGGGVGWQIGVQSTDLVLVFKTRNGLNRILEGKSKLTLGADVAVAAGPIGRQATAETDGQLKAEIFSYSRSRGLFVGLSLEGAGILMDCDSNEVFYQLRGGNPADVLAHRIPAVPVVAVNLKDQLARMTMVVMPLPAVAVPAPPPPPPPPFPPPLPRGEVDPDRPDRLSGLPGSTVTASSHRPRLFSGLPSADHDATLPTK